MAINQTVGAMRGPRWLLGFSQLPDKLHFYLIMPFLTSGLISKNRKKKWLKGAFHNLQWLGHPLCWTGHTDIHKNFMSFLEMIAFTDVIGHWARTTKKEINCMGLSRLLNMTTIFMIFCLTYCWFLICVFRYKEALLLELLIF